MTAVRPWPDLLQQLDLVEAQARRADVELGLLDDGAGGEALGAAAVVVVVALVAYALYRTRWAWSTAASAGAAPYPGSYLRAAFDHSQAAHSGSLDGIVFSGRVPEVAASMTAPVEMLHPGGDRVAPLDRARDVGHAHGWHIATVPGAHHQLPILRPKVTARWVRARLLDGFGAAAGTLD